MIGMYFRFCKLSRFRTSPGVNESDSHVRIPRTSLGRKLHPAKFEGPVNIILGQTFRVAATGSAADSNSDSETVGNIR